MDTLKKTDGTPPDTYPEDDVRPALIAHFHLARLYDKYLLPDEPQQKLRNKMELEYPNFVFIFIRILTFDFGYDISYVEFVSFA